MTSLTPMAAQAVAEGLRKGTLTLVDIREADEYAREHIEGALSLPLSRLASVPLNPDPGHDIVFQCRSGSRTEANCAQLATRAGRPAFLMAGGIESWKQQGLPVQADRTAPLEINRQVQITAGVMILAGIILSLALHPAFLALSAFVGAGLAFAGISGWCGMAKLLALAPWNRRGSP